METSKDYKESNQSSLRVGGRLRLLQLLMTLTIFGIIAFQVYWLRQNYFREERTLSLKTDVTFRETIFQLRANNLDFEKGGHFFNDSSGKTGLKVFVDNKFPSVERITVTPHKDVDIARTLNIVNTRFRDSLKKTVGKGRVLISMNNSAVSITKDSVKSSGSVEWMGPPPGGKSDYVMQFLYSVDSLQDSIKIKDIKAAYSKALQIQKIDIPFSIVRNEKSLPEEHEVPNKVTVGLSHPVTYELVKGNTFPYLAKRLASPFLFSVFLIGLTVVSFVLLYRNMKKQQRLAELKNDFISNITHELKTPIATVGVAIEALKNFNAMQNPERTREYLDISSNELNRLNLLVDKVLKLSMFEKKEIQLNREPLDLKNLTDEVLSSLRLQLEKRNASVVISHSGNTTLQGDKLHLLSVIFNLVDNALKYSPEKPEIKISIEEKENNTEFRIADNGVGIPDEYKSKVFEKFFRVPAGNVHNIKGYGLGLSYAASVIKKHGGTIEAINNEGGGTIFIITLPKSLTAEK